jgi:Na+/phosphate symporter
MITTVAFCLLVYVLFDIFKNHLIIFHNRYFFSKKKQRLYEEATIHRKDITNYLYKLAKKPLSRKEVHEWIKIARFNDDLFFSALPKDSQHFEKLEDLAKKLLEPEYHKRP